MSANRIGKNLRTIQSLTLFGNPMCIWNSSCLHSLFFFFRGVGGGCVDFLDLWFLSFNVQSTAKVISRLNISWIQKWKVQITVHVSCYALYGRRELVHREVEWAEKAELRDAELTWQQAKHVRLAPDMERFFDSSGFSADRALISASPIPQRGGLAARGGGLEWGNYYHRFRNTRRSQLITTHWLRPKTNKQ